MANPPLEGDSASKTVPGVKGTNKAAGGVGVYGESQQGDGMHGVSHAQGTGVVGINDFTSADPSHPDPNKPAGPGVSGSSKEGVGVLGTSDSGIGAWAHSNSNTGTGGVSETGIGVHGISAKGPAGVRGDCAAGVGVSANSVTGRAVEANSPQGTGVVGTSTSGVGVWGGSDSSSGVGGMSNSGHGVHGVSTSEHGVVGNCVEGTGVGVWGESKQGEGVHGVSHSSVAGVAGFNEGLRGSAGAGIWGESQQGEGVHGISHSSVAGVAGFNDGSQGSAGAGIFGESTQFDGVFGVSRNPQAAGVSGHSLNPDGTVNLNGLAGFFDGNVTVTGDIRLVNADCAEDFDIANAELVEPGTVMVLGDDGALRPSQSAYDKRVAGVVSGAGNYKPGIVLDKQESDRNRQPVALLGKVFCKVDAEYAPVAVGDLLTTSPTAGHGMKADDPQKAFGSVIGKALRPLPTGRQVIPILIALQ